MSYNILNYDPFTGKITGASYGSSDLPADYFAGKPVIVLQDNQLIDDDGYYILNISDPYYNWKVNLRTKTLEKINPTLGYPLPEISVSATQVNVAEGNSGSTAVEFTFSVSEKPQRTLLATYKTVDATAIAGQDYYSTDGFLSFSPDSPLTYTVKVAIIGDINYEASEYFSMQVNKGQGLVLASGGKDTARVTIINDDIFNDPSATIINGISGADNFISKAQNEKFNGNDGFDTLKMNGNHSDYLIARIDTNFVIEDKVANHDGKDVGNSIEKVTFNDGYLIYDLAFNSDNALIYRLYKAAFERTPDEGGLRYWAGVKANGADFISISDAFRNSPEFKTKYGELNNNDYVYKLYNNVLTREPDAGGLAWWQNELNTGHQTRDQVLIGFAGSAENVNGTAANIDNGYWLV